MATRLSACEVTAMARASTKENKNIYHKTREALHLTREATGYERLDFSSSEEKMDYVFEKCSNSFCIQCQGERLYTARRIR